MMDQGEPDANGKTCKEEATLRQYSSCLSHIGNLGPPWEPQSVARRVCAELQEIGFATIRVEVRDDTKEKTTSCAWRKMREVDGYEESDGSSISESICYRLRLCDAASAGGVTAVVYVSPREGQSTFTEIDTMCLGLIEHLAAGRLRDEAELASTVTTSIGASSHALRGPVTSVLDKIDGILHGSELSLSESVRTTLQKCQEKLEYVLEWCETSELLTQYRRGSCPKEDEFPEVKLMEVLPPLLETCQELLGWEFDEGDVPPDTRVRVHRLGLRRIIGDLVQNAEEHGIRRGPRKVTLSLLKQTGGNRVRVALSNASEGITPEMAADLQERARTPERMAFSPKFGIGAMLAAVIAKMHGGSLEVEVQDNLVTFSFTVPVCAPSPASLS